MPTRATPLGVSTLKHGGDPGDHGTSRNHASHAKPGSPADKVDHWQRGQRADDKDKCQLVDDQGNDRIHASPLSTKQKA